MMLSGWLIYVFPRSGMSVNEKKKRESRKTKSKKGMNCWKVANWQSDNAEIDKLSVLWLERFFHTETNEG